ncbi:MAG: OmpA family protein [Gammaproteobacteria bacterium]|nr:OmpA family protein [Gammaproteobacteria bacterium]
MSYNLLLFFAGSLLMTNCAASSVDDRNNLSDHAHVRSIGNTLTKQDVEKLTSLYYYAPGEVILDSMQKKLMQSLIEYLKLHPTQKILIVGHGDLYGSASDNKKIAQARADNVQDYMIEQGVLPKQIKTTNKGNEEPIALSNNPQAQGLNRRIEILYLE